MSLPIMACVARQSQCCSHPRLETPTILSISQWIRLSGWRHASSCSFYYNVRSRCIGPRYNGLPLSKHERLWCLARPQISNNRIGKSHHEARFDGTTEHFCLFEHAILGHSLRETTFARWIVPERLGLHARVSCHGRCLKADGLPPNRDLPCKSYSCRMLRMPGIHMELLAIDRRYRWNVGTRLASEPRECCARRKHSPRESSMCFCLILCSRRT